MKKTRTLVLLLALALAAVAGCRQETVLTDIDAGMLAGGSGIEAAAVFVDDGEAMSSLLKCVPPDSGVVPVWVTVKNTGENPLQIHNLNYLPLKDAFRGFRLEVGGNSLDPIHPLEAVMYIKGKADIPNYREIRAGHVVGGLIVWPLGIYYIVRGVQYSREYRPLLRHSFFPAGRGGYFEPVTIEPGGTSSGFVYFALLPEDNPYYREEVVVSGENTKKEKTEMRLRVRGDSGLGLTVNPAAMKPSYPDCETPLDTLATFVGLRRIRGEHGSWDGGAFFALSANGDRGGKLDLVTGTAEDLFESRSVSDLAVVAELNGKKAVLVDASSWGRRAVCAVNSKRSSRIFLLERKGGKQTLTAETQLDKKAISVIAAGEGIYVTTDAGHCHTFEYEDLKTKRYINMGIDVPTIVMADDRLITFGKKTAEIFGIRPGRNPERLGKTALSSSGKRDAHMTGEGIVVTHLGRGTHGDTLVLYDPHSLSEIARQPFPGKLGAVDFSPVDGVMVQMAGGMLMRLARKTADYGTLEAGWIPVHAEAFCMSDGVVGMLGEDGRIYAFEMESAVPGQLREGGAATVPIGIGTPYGEPEKKEKQKR